MIRYLCLVLAVLLTGCDRADKADTAPDVLHSLAEQGDTQGLMQAIVSPAQVDQRDVCYRTPLMLAAQFGHRDTVRQLLAAGAQVDLHEKGYYTALMLAAGNGHAEVVSDLADAGANVNEVEISRGWTALIWAAKRGHRETVAVLLDRGADRSHRDDQGRTARDWALSQKHRQIADLIGS
ncbi:ankyrin repeat domain-containing protein [Thiosocius teredinicola]|uniref:ankyrin repeat domain-containing protein n=1 Tax=Thiosocius teredinicola TaxID=1973002 RepID=UPI000990B07C